jgi:hypothetical protein
VLNAAVGPGGSSYTTPPWALKDPGAELQWRVVAMDENARSVARSEWRTLRTAAAVPASAEASGEATLPGLPGH